MRKVAIVTGGGGAIGLAIAEQLLANGTSVVVSDLHAEHLAVSLSHLTGHGSRVSGVVADATDEAEIAGVIATAENRYGMVDMYVANAGVFGGSGLEAPDGARVSAWSVNVMAHVRASRLLVPQWLSRAAALSRRRLRPGC